VAFLEGLFTAGRKVCESLHMTKTSPGLQRTKKKGHLPAPMKKIGAFSVLARQELVANG